MERETHKLRSEDFQADGSSNQHGSHDGDGGFEGALRAGFIVARHVPREDGDEGNRCRSTSEDVVQEVRNLEGREIRVRLMTGAKGPRDVHFAQIAQRARGQHGSHKQQRGGKSGVLVRRPQHAQQS